MPSLRSIARNKIPIAYTGRYGAGSLLANMFRSNPEGQMRAYGSVGTLFSIVNRLSVATSLVDWNLFTTSDSGKDEDREIVTNHPALTLWNTPNKFYTRQRFVEASQQHTELVGETDWCVERNSRLSLPTGLWPVRPDRIEPIPHPELFIDGWEYKSPDGKVVPLKNNEVIQVLMPNPLDPYRGLGPVQSVLVDLDATRYSAEWNRNFFINSAEPGGIIKVNKRLSEPEFRELKMRWNEQHNGVANAHRVAILEQGEWVDRKFSMRDMQFTELRNVSREVIREAFGFPKPLLGAVDDVNRANAEAAEVVFARWLIKPRLERIKQALNTQLLPMYGSIGQGFEFDYVDPVPENIELEAQLLTSRSNAAKTLVDAGWNADDVLSVVGLPEMNFRSQPTTGEVYNGRLSKTSR